MCEDAFVKLSLDLNLWKTIYFSRMQTTQCPCLTHINNVEE